MPAGSQADAGMGLSETLVRACIESLPHLFWTCAPDGRCDYLSPQWVAYTGRPASAQLGYGWLEQLHPDDAQETERRWAAAAAETSGFDTEFRIRRHDGEYRWFKTRARPILDAAGRITRWFGTNTDIQDLRDARDSVARANTELEARVQARTRELETVNTQLATSAAQLELAQAVASVGSWEYDIPAERVVWSAELYRIMGCDPAQPPPRYADQQSLFDPPSWAALDAAVRHAIATGEGYSERLGLTRRDGTRVVTIARAQTVRDAAGVVVKLVGTLQDVTEEDRTTRRLEQLSERLQLATSAAKMGVWDWNVQDDILVWDATMFDLYATSPEVFSGTYSAWRGFVHAEDAAEFERGLERARSGQGEFDSLFRVVHASGRVLHLRAVSATRRDAAGRPLRMVGVNWDVTEQREAELALRTREAQQRGILASAGSAIMATDAEGTFTLFNRAAEELLGYSADEIIGRATPLFIHDPAEVVLRREMLEAELGRPLTAPCDVFFEPARRGPPLTAEWTLLRNDSQRVPVLLTVNALRDSAQQIVGFLTVAVDLGPRKLQEQELLELNRRLSEQSERAEAGSRAKSMFLANMSHEIRTPLGAITGMSYLLGRTSLSAEQLEYTEALRRASQSLLGMINDVLDLVKIEAEQLSLECEPFSLGQLLDDLASLIRAYATGKNLELILNTELDLPELVRGDRVRLMQVLTNLLSNAVKFTEAGFVRLSVRRALDVAAGAAALQFEVEDSGVGIESELLERLFQPFSQGKSHAGGTGLGLAIVKQLVELMHGALGVRSAPKLGSTFWFRVPLPEVPRPPEEETRTVRALLVDDHEPQRLALMLCAERLRWRVTGASSGDEALGMVAEAMRRGLPYDAIVLDWRMPGRDGLATARALRDMTRDADPQPCLIMVTAFDPALLRAEAPPGLVDAILSKPVTPSALQDIVAQVHVGPQATALAEAQPTQRLSGLSVLVVDDSKVNRFVATRILELKGARVEAVGSGSEALTCLEGRPRAFDVVLMDLQMPGLDGVATARGVRQLGLELPIIALTAAALATERRRVLEAGMNDFVSKPFDPLVLVRCILRHARAHPALPQSARPTDSGASAWPRIDGLDANDARIRLGGDAQLLRRLLDGLLEEFADLAPREPASDARAAELEGLAGRLHKLRGSAGNLGARALQRAAGEAEASCLALVRSGDRRPTEAALLLLASVARELERLRASARSLVAEPASSPDTALPTALPSSADIERFSRCLTHHDLAALTVFERISPRLRELLGPAQYAELSAALERLDFVQALALMPRPPQAVDAPSAC